MQIRKYMHSLKEQVLHSNLSFTTVRLNAIRLLVGALPNRFKMVLLLCLSTISVLGRKSA